MFTQIHLLIDFKHPSDHVNSFMNTHEHAGINWNNIHVSYPNEEDKQNKNSVLENII